MALSAFKLSAVRAELTRLARERETTTYGALGKIVGLIARGVPPYLEAIKAEERAVGRPDLGCLVVTQKTGWPGYVENAHAGRAEAERLRQAVFEAWAV